MIRLFRAVLVLVAATALSGAALAQPQSLLRVDFEPAGRGGLDGTASTTPADGLRRVPGLVGAAVAFGPGDGVLVVPMPDTGSRRAALDPGAVAVRFWYRPDGLPAGGGGAESRGRRARWLGLGDREQRPQEGWWELSLIAEADGPRLEFSCGSSRSDVYRAVSRPLNLVTNEWCEWVLNVFPGRVRAYLDGQSVLEESPSRLPRPGPAALRAGWVIGGAADGRERAEGALDQLEFFDRPLERVEAAKRGTVITAEPSPAGRGLAIRWTLSPVGRITLQRSPFGSNQWETLQAGPPMLGFDDATAEPDRSYDYRVLSNGVPCGLQLTAGLRMSPIEDRGTTLLLVDETLAASLASELGRWERDLVADGWRVRRLDVPRHDDRDWSRNTNAIARIRSWVQERWRESAGTARSLFLVGHVAIPYAGMETEDRHTGPGDNHLGAWPSDHYYGDVDGLWTDRAAYPRHLAAPTFPITRNEPGDGKFDQDWAPPNDAGEAKMELAFGRVDFVRLPAFGRSSRSEVELLRRYLSKAHRYRVGEMPVRPGAVVGGFFGTWSDGDVFRNGLRGGTRMFGAEARYAFEGDLFGLAEDGAVTWGFQSGPGAIDRIRTGSPGMITAATLADRRRQARVAFAMLMGSWFGDWAAGENNLLRSIIASEDYGLAAIWVRFTDWRFDPLALGGTLGDAQLRTANESIHYLDGNRGTTRTLTILGDPNLRLRVTPPPRDLRGKRDGDGVGLEWTPGAGGTAGDYVYRSTRGWRGPYERVAAVEREGRYRDPSAPRGAVYLVRSSELIVSGSGSYTNLSQGVYWPEPK